MSKKIVVVGGTGAYLGQHITRAALDQGHEVTVVSRGRSERNASLYDEFESRGATFAAVEIHEIDKMVEVFTGKDVVFSFPGIGSHRSSQIRILLAAKLAGIQRFVPDEYGMDTTVIDFGLCEMFDQKKDFTMVCRVSEVPFTALMVHAIASDWMLPTAYNQETFKIVGTGDVKLRLTHKKDVAAMAVMAACDPRCANKIVSTDGGGELSVNEMVADLRANFPDKTFEYVQRPPEEVLKGATEGSEIPPPGEQSEREREQLNKLVYIDGLCSRIGPDTLKATDLFPDYQWVSVRGMLKDPSFVFKA